MGKYILIEFDTDDSAERLCAQINTASANGKPFRVAGVFFKPPKKRCECPGVTQSTMKVTGRKRSDLIVQRHKKTGFYYCTQCKRVRKGWQSPRNQLDPLNLPVNFFSKGLNKEASLTLDYEGNLLRNFPLRTRTTAYDRPIGEQGVSRKP